ncbi:site-specific DNA-methyltransferase [Actinotignum urinale]|uniref:site-specific DNA-methyltransferase n=1 Tax=Actinotignum urinale TaxID=190146 RepID=UPI002A838E45|nr:site-specific DNA-methyltransferase [Actinotignum urinale]MDY5152047.1 site-specific DNA-methyltransferase [Actinotignum urinale]
MANQRLQLTWYNKDKALIPTETGKYGYTWVDPSDPRYCETHTLIYDEYVEGKQTFKSDEFEYSERADLEPQDDNLLILGESGDVLEALTRVPELAEKYVGQVKLIYIDPPFNTAQTFASYEDNLEHSIWLTMMRDRLMHMKKLLTNDGSIWVHLDDVENHRMRLLLDEVFGAGCFLAEIAWEKTFKPRNDATFVSSRHDVILVYRRAEGTVFNKLARTAEMNSSYSNPDDDLNGSWTSAPATAPGAKTHQGMVFGVQHPMTGNLVYPPTGQCWRFGQDRFLEIMRGWNSQYILREIHDSAIRAEICDVAESEIRPRVPALVIEEFDSQVAMRAYKKGNWPLVYVTNGGKGGFRRKTYLTDMGQRAVEDLWFYKEVGSNDEAKNEIKNLFTDASPFSTPKPERLLERIIHIGSNPGDIVLDVFAGSGTTVAVAQKMGRRWVTCELLESTFTTFTRPRLEKVVNDQDPGGITRTKGERVDATKDGLPDGVSPEDAAKFTSVLNKLIKDDPEAKKDPRVKSLKAASKTRRTKEVVNWRGGGGFQVAQLSPACFDYDPALDRVMLTAAATGETLTRSVAANLGFTLLHTDDDYIFDARRGNALLKVVEGVATIEIVDWLASQIQPGETIVLAAITVMDGVRQHLRKLVKGARVVALPDDVFRYSEGGEL